LAAITRPMVNLNVDSSVKSTPQSGIVDPRDVLFENSCAPRIIERGDHLADFAARPAKKTRRRWTPPQPGRVDFIGHGKYGRFILGIPGDGETQEKQQPFPNPAGARILRTELLHLISCYLGDRLQLGALRRNGAADEHHGLSLAPTRDRRPASCGQASALARACAPRRPGARIGPPIRHRTRSCLERESQGDWSGDRKARLLQRVSAPGRSRQSMQP